MPVCLLSQSGIGNELLEAYLPFSYFFKKMSLPMNRTNIFSSGVKNFSSVYNVGILSKLHKYFIGS